MWIRVACLIAAAGCARADAPLPPPGDDPPDATEPAPLQPALLRSRQLCKLLSDHDATDPTPNDVHHTANVLGADLGIPVVARDKLYLLFGDTIGKQGIWPAAESHPDAVGYGLDSATDIAAQPSLLCSRLRIVTLPVSQSIGPTQDPTIAADFAGAAMAPPAGHALGEYIHNPSGKPGDTAFPHLPGDFEVPSGAFSVGDAIYVFYTTVVAPSNVAMVGSYLAKWERPTTVGPFAYQILHRVDSRQDAMPLGGRYINVAAEVAGDAVYLFGTGEYRKSGIHAAKKPLAQLDAPGGYEELGEIVATRGYGELSVRYFPSLRLWMLLAEELTATSNRIVAYVASRPEGPWSAPLVVHDWADAAFRGQYCCATENACDGAQMFNCNRTAFYGAYLFPFVLETADSFTITYTLSSFSPYNVALFQAVFAK